MLTHSKCNIYKHNLQDERENEKNIENEKAFLKSALDYEQIQMFNEKKENL